MSKPIHVTHSDWEAEKYADDLSWRVHNNFETLARVGLGLGMAPEMVAANARVTAAAKALYTAAECEDVYEGWVTDTLSTDDAIARLRRHGSEEFTWTGHRTGSGPCGPRRSPRREDRRPAAVDCDPARSNRRLPLQESA